MLRIIPAALADGFLLIGVCLFEEHVPVFFDVFTHGLHHRLAEPEDESRARWPVSHAGRFEFPEQLQVVRHFFDAVFEDGLRQEIQSFSQDELPLAVALVIDRSGSISPYIAELRRIATRALDQLKPEDEVTLFSFADDVRMVEALTADSERITSGIARIRTGGGTNIIDAVYESVDYLARTAPERRHAVILLSDNQATVQPQASESGIIRKAMETFTGVQRRFDIQVEREDVVYIDDYAHHPRELDAFIRSVRELYPGRMITGIFQPHLYSRTKDLADGFADSLAGLDELILLDIYPARELPVEGVSSELIFKKMEGKNKIGKEILAQRHQGAKG